MIKISETGRSMIEMLGVLAIIGVLSVGGLQVIGRMQASQKSAQLVADVAEFVNLAKKMSCQYDNAYDTDGKGNLSMFMYKNNAYPKNWEYDGKSKFIGDSDATYTIYKSGVVSSVLAGFSVQIIGLGDTDCMKLVTSNIVKKNNNLGFKFIQLNGRIFHDAIDMATAVKACSKKKNNIYIDFKGCI